MNSYDIYRQTYRATYSELLDGLNPDSKSALIDSLSRSLKKVGASRESDFYQSFGAFAPEQSAKEIIAFIKSSRKFRKRKSGFDGTPEY